MSEPQNKAPWEERQRTVAEYAELKDQNTVFKEESAQMRKNWLRAHRVEEKRRQMSLRMPQNRSAGS